MKLSVIPAHPVHLKPGMLYAGAYRQDAPMRPVQELTAAFEVTSVMPIYGESATGRITLVAVDVIGDHGPLRHLAHLSVRDKALVIVP